jgi:hypothetical protein
MNTSPHKSDFAYVNGIRLHYLDWGGSGPVLLFLACVNTNAHIFNSQSLDPSSGKRLLL